MLCVMPSVGKGSFREVNLSSIKQNPKIFRAVSTRVASSVTSDVSVQAQARAVAGGFPSDGASSGGRRGLLQPRDPILRHRFGCLFPKLSALPLTHNTRVAAVRGDRPSSFQQTCSSPRFLPPRLGMGGSENTKSHLWMAWGWEWGSQQKTGCSRT